MPIYEYEDIVTGRRTVKIVPVDNRDAACPDGHRRIIVPERVSVMAGAIGNQQTASVRKGLRTLECSNPGFDFKREMGWSANELNRIWKENE